MNRRGFLAALSAAFVADPERLLWTPGAKLISIPAPIVWPKPPFDHAMFERAWQPGSFAPDHITREWQRYFVAELAAYNRFMVSHEPKAFNT
jgi:hypothetical protein